MQGITKFVGLDVSRDRIEVAIADSGGGRARLFGGIRHEPEAVRRLMLQLGCAKEIMVVYEAGPTGYGLQRLLQGMGIACMVAAPSLIPVRPGDRVKTDRRDAMRLAELLRAGELVGVWVPGEADEALRDLVRAREDAKQDLLRARHRLQKLLLRRGLRPPEGVRNWSAKYRRWLDSVKIEQPGTRLAFEEYLHSLHEIEERIKRLEAEIHLQATDSVHAPVIQALQTFRGVAELTATTLVAEVGLFSRFDNPAQLMAYAGLVPREHSSGSSRWQGGITKTGNAHPRRVVVEAAWSYRYPSAVKGPLRKRYEGQPAEIQAIAWKAQQRLHRKYVRLVARGKPTTVALTAVARELLGFLWDAARRVEARMPIQAAA